MHYLAVVGRNRIDVDGNQFVLLVTNAFCAQGPDINKVFLADNFRHVGRHAGLVGERGCWYCSSRSKDQADAKIRSFPQ